uniref:Uncharacterized protein n=1 Tax=Rattus norvegicus TaxID=10116 RepID=D4AC54_RAT
MVMALGALPHSWLPEDGQVRLSIGQFCVAEHHNAVLSSFVEAKHSFLVVFDAVYPRDHLIFALVVAGLVVRFPLVKQRAFHTVSLGAASIRAGWALLTRLPKGSRLCALALPTDATASVAADLPILGPARADVC